MNSTTVSFRCLTASLILISTVSCTVGPDYQRPDVSAQVPESFDLPAGWKVAEPRDHLMDEWWKLFEDQRLNRLMNQADANNQDLKAAFARVEQARAISNVARSAWFPMFEFNPSANRTRRSDTISNTAQNLSGRTVTNISLPLQMQYEIDLWGRLRRAIEAAEAETLASESNLRQVLLTLRAELATNYFSMRSLDAEMATFREAIELRRTFLDLNQQRFGAGEADEVDVARAETELAATEAALTGLRRTRSDFEDAIAVLVGEPSSNFDLTPDPLVSAPPRIPVSVPSELLERRPDVAEAERIMAAENARIGVARAAFYPAVRLTGHVGLESGGTSDLFSMASRTWGIGPELSLPVFKGGINKAELRRAEARYDEAAALYRQTILEAVSEVDQALTGVTLLQEQAAAQGRAASAARRTVELSQERRKAGLVDYFEVVDAQRTLLDAEQQLARVTGARYLAAVALARALGGGWR